jgi:hypothetical protein
MPKQDSAWKHYYNAEYGYCLKYPSRWFKGDAFEGAGVYFSSGERKHSRPVGEIDIEVLRAPTPSLNLTDDFESHLAGVKRFQRAQQVEVLEKRPVFLLGANALLAKDRYYDPQDRTDWIDEILFVRREGVLYRLALECRPDQAERFESVFTHLVESFQFKCPEPIRSVPATRKKRNKDLD